MITCGRYAILSVPFCCIHINAFQHRRPPRITGRTALLYFFRFLVSLLTMEIILHFIYVVAIKDTKAWVGDTPAEISMIGFWNLIIVWLKASQTTLMIIVAAITSASNTRLDSSCYLGDFSDYGRSWTALSRPRTWYGVWQIIIPHSVSGEAGIAVTISGLFGEFSVFSPNRSRNCDKPQRYIYIPLGGMQNIVVNTIIVFSFVALWHDLTFRLLAWGWLVSLFILPELLASYLFPASRVRTARTSNLLDPDFCLRLKFGNTTWYRHVAGAGAVFNIILMMSANLVGFVIGPNGIRFFVEQLFGTSQG